MQTKLVQSTRPSRVAQTMNTAGQRFLRSREKEAMPTPRQLLKRRRTSSAPTEKQCTTKSEGCDADPGRVRAALRIQAWARRLQFFVWDAHTICMERKWGRGDTVHLVEPCGSCFSFRASSLALACIATAQFAHPITRRPFSETEIKRLVSRAPPRCALLLRYTALYRTPIQQAVAEHESLQCFLHAAAGDGLDAALSLTEDGASVDDVYDALEMYEETMRQALAHFPALTRQLLVQHQALVVHRQHSCGAGWTTIRNFIGFLRRRHWNAAPVLAAPGEAAFVKWLQLAT